MKLVPNLLLLCWGYQHYPWLLSIMLHWVSHLHLLYLAQLDPRLFGLWCWLHLRWIETSLVQMHLQEGWCPMRVITKTLWRWNVDQQRCLQMILCVVQQPGPSALLFGQDWDLYLPLLHMIVQVHFWITVSIRCYPLFSSQLLLLVAWLVVI